jgi:hypothetical protein
MRCVPFHAVPCVCVSRTRAEPGAHVPQLVEQFRAQGRAGPSVFAPPRGAGPAADAAWAREFEQMALQPPGAGFDDLERLYRASALPTADWAGEYAAAGPALAAAAMPSQAFDELERHYHAATTAATTTAAPGASRSARVGTGGGAGLVAPLTRCRPQRGSPS